MRRVVVLGATGSVGTQTLEVVAAHPDRFRVVGLAARRDAERLVAAARRFGVTELAVVDHEAAAAVRDALPEARVRAGERGVAELAALDDADVVVNAVVGARGLSATLAALEAGHTVALANKESLIVGGEFVVAAAERAGGRERLLVPVDSEHAAVAHCLRAGERHRVRRVWLTASGGPFRGRRAEDLEDVTVEDALAHPTWNMGEVITVNSATLMNKGLELIEAHHLFDLPYERLGVVVHPQSVVHALVEFADGATIAQLAPPDMRIPIQQALSWPDRLDHRFATLDWGTATALTFEPVDRHTFPAVDLAVEAGRRGGAYPAVLNAANEEAVAAFLAGRARFPAIVATVAHVLEDYHATGPTPPRDLEDVLAADAWARRRARELLGVEVGV